MNLGVETSKLNNYLLPTTEGALKWVSQPGVVHDRVFLEAIPISCLSSLWFQWSLSVEGMKERKKKYRERDGIWEKMKERKKKNFSETEIEETFTSEDEVLPWLKQDFLKQALPWLKQVPLHNNFWKVMLSSRGYVVKKEPHNFLSFFRKGLHSTVITFFLDSWLLFFWLNWLFGFLLQTII